MAPPQTVIYRLNDAEDPAWQFYSMPESIVGGGKTLSKARAEYRAALKFSLDSVLLPGFTEYVERQVGNSGIWLRLPIDYSDFDGVIDRVRAELAAYPEDREFFFANRTAGGDPVVVAAASPDDSLRTLLDQMTNSDCLILAMMRHTPEKVQNVWLALAGSETEGGTEPLASFASLGLTPESPIRDLHEAAINRHVSKISALALC